MLLAVAHGFQAALMAPTEILARQHAATLQRDLRESRVRIQLLTGSLSAAQRRQTLEQIAAGEADLIVGTHALLQESIDLAKLALVVIDEQHKFGVNQRAALRRAGADPHYLVMTATPIPRTISMTLFGDSGRLRCCGKARRDARRSIRTWAPKPNAAAGGNSSARSCARAGRAT